MRLVVPCGAKAPSALLPSRGSRDKGGVEELLVPTGHWCPRMGGGWDSHLLCHDGGEKEAAAQPEGVDLGADDLEGFAEVGGFLQLQ